MPCLSHPTQSILGCCSGNIGSTRRVFAGRNRDYFLTCVGVRNGPLDQSCVPGSELSKWMQVTAKHRTNGGTTTATLNRWTQLVSYVRSGGVPDGRGAGFDPLPIGTDPNPVPSPVVPGEDLFVPAIPLVEEWAIEEADLIMDHPMMQCNVLNQFGSMGFESDGSLVVAGRQYPFDVRHPIPEDGAVQQTESFNLTREQLNAFRGIEQCGTCYDIQKQRACVEISGKYHTRRYDVTGAFIEAIDGDTFGQTIVVQIDPPVEPGWILFFQGEFLSAPP